MTIGLRIAIALIGVAASGIQVFVGALSSLGLGAPGVGPEADWIPPTLVNEGFTLVPLGFALTLWGSAWGLRLAGACAVISALIGVVAASMLAPAGGVLQGLVFFLVPGVILAGTIAYVARRASSAPFLGRAEEAAPGERPSRSAGL